MKEREGNVLVSLWWFLCSGPGLWTPTAWCVSCFCWDRLCMPCWNCNRPLSMFLASEGVIFLNNINRQTQALYSFSYNRKTSDVHYDSRELRPKTVLGFNEYELLRIFVIYIDEILEPTRSLCRELTIRNIEEHFRRSW